MFSFCTSRILESTNWVEYQEWRTFFLKVRISNLASLLRKRTRQISRLNSKFIGNFKDKHRNQNPNRAIYKFFYRVAEIFNSICNLISRLLNNKKTLLNPEANLLDTLLKRKKSIIQKSSRMCKSFESILKFAQKRLFRNLGKLLTNEKLLETCAVLLNLSNFRDSSAYKLFLTDFQQLIKLITRTQGGMAYLFRKPDLSAVIDKGLDFSHNFQGNFISALAEMNLEGGDQIAENKFLDFSLIEQKVIVKDKETEKKTLSDQGVDGVGFNKSEVINAHFSSFYKGLGDSVSLLNALYRSLFAMYREQDLIESLVQVNTFINSAALRKQCFSLVFKEPSVLKLFLTILNIEEDPGLLYKMHKEILLCISIFNSLFQSSPKTFYLMNNCLQETFTSLEKTLSMGLSKQLIPFLTLQTLSTKIVDFKTNLVPFSHLSKDLQKFSSFFKEQSRYTMNNIQTLLSNKNIRFDDEREFPEEDQAKRLTRLRDDYLSFFGLGQGLSAKSSLANLTLLSTLVMENPSAIHKLVEADCFSPVVLLVRISVFILKSFLEGGEFAAQLKDLFLPHLNGIFERFFQLLDVGISITLTKTKFKLQQENYSKEYENVDLFKSMLTLLKIIWEYFPEMLTSMIDHFVLQEEDWAKERLFFERKNPSFADENEDMHSFIQFLRERPGHFFNLFAKNKKYGPRDFQKKDLHLKIK